MRVSSFLLSLLLHAADALLALWLSQDRAAKPRPEPITVTLRGGEGAPRNESRAKTPKHVERGRKDQRPVPLSRLGLAKPSPNEGSVSTPSGNARGAGNGTGTGGGADGYDFANTLGIEKDSQLYSYFGALYHRLSGATGYPREFTEQHVKGQVTVQFRADRQGRFTGEILDVDSDQPMLKTYVLAILFFALKEPLHENHWLPEDAPETLTLVARFEFDLFSDGAQPKTAEVPQFKNLLHIVRSAWVRPKLSEAYDAVTAWVPPIIVVPGGFAIDFIRAYQLAKNYKGRHKIAREDLRESRTQMMLRQWHEVVRKGQGP